MKKKQTYGLLVAVVLAASACGSSDGEDEPGDGGDSAGVDAGDPPEGACGPDSCDGCCSGDTCLAGDSTAACGVGGGECIDCGNGFECAAAATCEVTESSRWDLTLVSASINEQNLDNQTWDDPEWEPDGIPPDVHIDVKAGAAENEHTGRSSTVNNTTEPSFGDVVLTDVSASDLLAHLNLRALDTDTLNDDDIIGACDAQLDTSSFSGADQTLDCPRDPAHDQAGFSVVYQITAH